ncbi:hypothetical protein [Chitinolyticbacter meiyuanensis]|uniref:hypothetical protein n=1 Tax=Chitinolyticbacter meiyuanensis TaxID=682798 RepID=UPI0011E5F9FA|nr:hypothetical protein [Chitinolyticbacter meiyuanensis]
MSPLPCPACWFESFDRTKDRLLMAREEAGGAFWLALVNNEGAPVGWLHFSPITVAKGQVLFELTEMRPASGPTPDQSGMWSGVSKHQPGFPSIER